jgi:hypothetical protein
MSGAAFSHFKGNRIYVPIIQILSTNLIVHLLIYSDVILIAAQALVSVGLPLVQFLRNPFGTIQYTIYQGGYPNDHGDLAVVTFLPSLGLQYWMTRRGSRCVSRKLGSPSRILPTLWKNTFFGIPQLALVLIYDCASCAADVGYFGSLVLIAVWLAYFFLAALLQSRRYIRARTIAIVPLCAQCGYWLSSSCNRCPECGTHRRVSPFFWSLQSTD